MRLEPWKPVSTVTPGPASSVPGEPPGQGVEPELFFLPSYVLFSHVGQGSGQCLPGGQYLPAVPSRSQVKGREGRSSEVSGRTANGLHVRGYTVRAAELKGTGKGEVIEGRWAAQMQVQYSLPLSRRVSRPRPEVTPPKLTPGTMASSLTPSSLSSSTPVHPTSHL